MYFVLLFHRGILRQLKTKNIRKSYNEALDDGLGNREARACRGGGDGDDDSCNELSAVVLVCERI